MDRALLHILAIEIAARRAVIRVTALDGSQDRLVLAGALAPGDPLHDELAQRFRSGTSGLVEADGRRLFLTVILPPPRIVAIGAVHITQALAPMARLAGFDITIIDPRTAFASAARFEGAALLAEWPEDVMPGKVPLDAHTALVAVTHDPKIDDLPLAAALKAGAFYVGALGSRKTHGGRMERLKAAGLTDAQLARIRAPIGLDIGAQSPGEIAVAILGEIITALRGPKRG